METLIQLLKKDWKKLNEKLENVFEKVKPLMPEGDAGYYERRKAISYSRVFTNRIKLLEEIRQKMLVLLEEKSKIDRKEFHRLNSLEPKTEIMRALLFGIILRHGRRKLYRRFRIVFRSERGLLKKILKAHERDIRIDNQLVDLLRDAMYEETCSYNDFYRAIYGSTNRKEPYMLLIVLRELRELQTKIYKELSKVVSKDEEVTWNLKDIEAGIGDLSPYVKDEEEFIRNLREAEDVKVDKKIEDLLRRILKRTITTEKQVESILKEQG